MTEKNQGTILIADDVPVNLKIISRIFEKSANYNIVTAVNGVEAIEKIKVHAPDLVLLDVIMPEADGYQVAEFIRDSDIYNDIPVIFMTGIDDAEFREKFPETGAKDYISKPIDKDLLIFRVKVNIELKKAKDELLRSQKLIQDKEFLLLNLIDEQTSELMEVVWAIVSSLENSNHIYHGETKNHLIRIREYCNILAEKYGCNAEFIRKVRLFSSLHDIGKICIPENILKKPDSLTNQEFDAVKSHVYCGYKMLQDSSVDEIAKNIIKYHHEKWDGTGYLEGLAGYNIPLEARIVAVADVYDALSFQTVYKESLSEDKTKSLMFEASGLHFEPRLVELLYDNINEFIEIKEEYS